MSIEPSAARANASESNRAMRAFIVATQVSPLARRVSCTQALAVSALASARR
jgi:hypothetical protein